MAADGGARAPFKILIQNVGGEIQVPGETNLLAEMQLTNARGKIIDGCRGGGCGVCRVKVLQGKFECGQMSKSEITEEELAEGEVLSCQLFPKSDLVIQTMGKRFRHVENPQGMAYYLSLTSKMDKD